MKWFQSTAPAPSHAAAEPATATLLDTLNFDQSLDTVAAMLRLTGKYCLAPRPDDVERIRQESEAWARHALVCTPPPGSDASASAIPGRRDWSSLRHFATQTRQHEYESVMASVGGLREAIWSFVDGLSRALVDGQDFDDRVLDRLDDLKGTLREESPETLGRVVESAVTELTRLLHEHKEQQQMRLSLLGERVSELAEELQEVRRESTVDELTSLFNAKAFEDYVAKTAYLRAVFGQEASLLLIDVDSLEAINTEHGRGAGDEVLRAVANCVARTFPRRSDVAARLEDDQLGVLVSGTSLRDAIKLTDRLLASIREIELPVETGTVRLTVSVGVSEIGKSESAIRWCERTEAALAEAKSTGRDRYWLADEPA